MKETDAAILDTLLKSWISLDFEGVLLLSMQQV